MSVQQKIRRIAILGSTGSIGRQTLDVIDMNPDKFIAEVLVTNSNAELLIEQSLKFNPNTVIIADTEQYYRVKDALKNTDIKVYAGERSVTDIVESSAIDIVLIALVGFSGLNPTLNAIKNKKNIALATKEAMVVAGNLLTKEAEIQRTMILPVDSEHSAILQCITGEQHKTIEKIILTASGGPFKDFSYEDLEKVTVNQALKHPNWSMGKKITIDSATMMNKGMEVIEASYLFNIHPEDIQVVFHPQSVIHSMVQFCDGSVKAQLGCTDMRLPILYAIGFPYRYHSKLPRLNFENVLNLTFEKPDIRNFPCLELAYEAVKTGGSMPCILNASNELAVDKFLNKKIKFSSIAKIIEDCMNNTELFVLNPSIEDIFEVNKNTCIFANEIINKNYLI